MSSLHRARPKAAAIPSAAAVLTKAVLRAAEQLALTNRVLARVLGVSEATISRMRNGEYELQEDDKPFELGVLFVRLYRSLDSINGGDEKNASVWLRSANLALGGTPLAMIQTVSGLVNVIHYLDARRAVV
jgi:hypothetical protein